MTPRRLVVPAGVAWTRSEDGGVSRVFVAPVPHGPILVLDGTAAVIWQLAREGDASGLPDRVARAVDAPVETIRDEVEDFVAHLVERGLLSGP